MAPSNGSKHAGSTAAQNGQLNVETAMAAARVVLRPLAPLVENGLFPARAVVGQRITAEAEIFMDGHDQLAARVWVLQDGAGRRSVPLRELGNDRWAAEIALDQVGRCSLRFEAWLDRWGSYRHALQKKHAAQLDVTQEVLEGQALVATALAGTAGIDAQALSALLEQLRSGPAELLPDLLLSETTAALMNRCDTHPFATYGAIEPQIEVEREAAGFSSWYELFPRSQNNAGRHGTFDDVIARLPAIRAMGFDVLYLPPIHPIGRAHRKGPNNSLQAGPDDPGSPYAIGSADGGHDAVHPDLGGIEGFRRLRAAAAEHGLELALDFAVQCSQDHPWLKEHPEWFQWRPDGSIRYAENPPKKYQDIVNVDFYAEGAVPSLWLALRDVVLGWAEEGVRLFRVDNPHTKPLPFWQWLIAEVRACHPDAMFLSEAFTRPTMMYRLAQIGFSQSYSYFTWRNTKQELTEYFTELSQTAPRHFYRPHLFVNTPDINPWFLQTSGRAGFLIRAALAATLSGLWGLYSGFELCESAALPDREEYLDSEKYQLRPRDWHAPGNIIAEISRLNHIRRANPALHSHLGVKFHTAWNDQILYFSKSAPHYDSFILVAISLDPHHPQETHFELPLSEFGLGDDGTLEVEELMQGGHFRWTGKIQHWYFDPQRLPFAVWRVRPVKS